MTTLERKKEIIEALRQSKVFEGLGDEAHEQLFSLCYLEMVDKHAKVISEGDATCRDFFVLLQGTVGISLSRDGNPIEITKMSAVSILGEMAFATSQPRSATVTAQERCYFARFPAPAILSHIESNPQTGLTVYRNFIGILSKKLEKANEQIKNNNLTYLDSLLSDLDI